MTRANELYYEYRKRLNKENNTRKAYKREDDKGSGTRNARYISEVLGDERQAVDSQPASSVSKPKTREELLSQYRSSLGQRTAEQAPQQTLMNLAESRVQFDRDQAYRRRQTNQAAPQTPTVMQAAQVPGLPSLEHMANPIRYADTRARTVNSNAMGLRGATTEEQAIVAKQADKRAQEQKELTWEQNARRTLGDPNARVGGVNHSFSGSMGNVDETGRMISPLSSRYEQEYGGTDPTRRTAAELVASRDPENPLNTGADDNAYRNMTDEERSVYNYLYSTYGPSRAEEYHNGLLDEINRRTGQQTYENMKDENAASKVAFNFIEGLGSGLSGIAEMPSMLMGEDVRKAKSPNEYAAGMIRSDEGNTRGEQIAYDIASSTGNMTPGLVLSAIGAPAALSSAVFAASQGGNAYREAMANGEDISTARAYGVQQFADEEATNFLLGGINAFGGGKIREVLSNSAAGRTLDAAVDRLVKSESGRKALHMFMDYVGDMAGEAQQEYVQFYTENFTKALLGMKDENGNPVQFNLNPADPDALYAALLGALNAGLLNTAPTAQRYLNGAGTDVSDARNIAAELRQTTREEYTSDAAYESARNMVAIAEEIAAKQDAGAEITNMEKVAYNEAMAEFVEASAEGDAEFAAEEQREIENVMKAGSSGFVGDEAIARSEEAALNRAAARELSDTFGEEGRRAFSSLNPDEAVNSYRDFAGYYNHLRFGTAAPDSERTSLSSEQISAALKAGAADANAAYPQETVSAANRAVRRVSLENVTPGNVDTSGIDIKSLTPQQKLRVDYAGALVSKAFGMDVRFVKSDAENGAYQGMNGSYQVINGRPTITLDVNAGMNRESDWTGDLTDIRTMFPVISHELTHHLEQTNPALYRQLSNAVIQSLAKNENYTEGGTINQVIRAERNRMDRMEFDANGNQIRHTDEDAIHEIVARACEDFLSGDKRAAKIFDNVDAETKQTLWDHVKEVFDNIKEFFTQMLSSYKSDSREAKAIRQNMEEYERIRGIWEEALTGGTETETESSSVMESESIAENPAPNQSTREAFSVRQFAQSLDLDVDLRTEKIYDPKTGKEIRRVTEKMMEQTPMGSLVKAALDAGTIDAGTAQKQLKMFKDLMNLTIKYSGSDEMVWQIAGTYLFSSVKTNSDKQYSTTVDYGTICSKTQALIDVLSKTMVEKGRGLTREEVLKAYNKTAGVGLSVPCPVCYVFSRWMGVPSLLDTMRKCQMRFGKASEAEIQSYIKSMLDEYESPKGVNEAKTKVQNRLAVLDRKLQEALDKNDLTTQAEVRNEVKDLEKKMSDLESFNWVTQVRCNKNKDGSYKLDPKYKSVPNETLLDLTKSGEFAQKYPKAWKYRTTRGAGMGKAIMPYSGAALGDFIKGNKDRWADGKNPFFMKDAKAAKAAINRALKRARGQNLIGGQRFQSTSDFRAEWGIDYLMTFLECQAAGSQVQLYTKVIEAVDMFASAGAEVNLSIMPRDNGYENGKLVFSDVTGVNFDDAYKKTRLYDNVQMILVGINDDHIRLAMADDRIGFIIPWHPSGNSKETLANLMQAVGETLSNATSYEDSQNDKIIDNSDEMKALRQFRKDIIQGKLWENYSKKEAKALTDEQQSMLDGNPYLKELYRRFYQDTSAKEYGVQLNGNQASGIFPYEYWDTSLSIKDADQNGRRFQEYCASIGIQPRFSQFADDTGYWKLLIDRRMYNRDGTYHGPKAIDVTGIKVKQIPQAVNSNNYKDISKINQATLDTIRALDDQHNDLAPAEDRPQMSMRNADMSEELAASREQMDERYLARMADVIAEKDAEIEKLKAKMDKAVGAEKEKAKERLEKLRKDKNDRIAYLEKSYKANLDWRIAELRQKIDKMKDASAEERRNARERLEKLRAQKNQKIEEILQKNREQRLKRRESKAMQELLRRARRLMSESRKGTPEFRAQVDSLIGDLDLVSAGIRDKTRTKLEDLRKQVEAQSKLDPDYAKYEAPKYADLLNRIAPSTKHVSDMSLADIVDLTQAIVALEHSKRIADREIDEGRGRLFGHYGKVAVEQQKKAKGINYNNEIGAQLGKYRLNMLNPVRGFALIDGYQKDGVFTHFGKQLNDGQTKAAKFRMEVEKMFHDIDQNKKLVDDFAKQTIEIDTLEGKKKISKGMRIALYLHLQNLDNVKHIAFGGITIPNERLYSRGKYAEAYAAGETVHLSEWIPGAIGESVSDAANRKNDAAAAAAIRKITDQMTPEELEYAKIAQEFFDVKTKNAINEVSLELNGYEKANVDNYFPIHTDSNYLQSNFDGLMQDGTIEGIGMLKERTGSRLPIYLEDASQVVLRQKNNTAMYYGLAIPIRNFTRFYNYTGGERLERNVKASVGKTWNKTGLDYIDHVLNDLQFGRQTDRSFVDTFKGIYAGTTLNLNLGVAIKQSASYPFAASVIGWKPLAKGAKAAFGKSDRDYMDSITPWGYMRRQGFSGTEMGEVAKQRTGVENNQALQKAKRIFNLIQNVDVKTTEVLFAACEEYVKEQNPDLEVRGEEYSKKLAEVYNEVLQRTQPSYDVMQRNEFLRSKNDLAKIFGMFKTQTFNMGGELLDAWGRWRAYSEYAKTDASYKKDKEEAGKAFRTTVAATMASQMMLAVLSAAANALLHKMRPYRDDKGEVTAVSLAGKIVKDFAGSFAGMLFGGNEVQSFATALFGNEKWYDIEYPGLNMVNDIASSLVDLKNALGKAIDTGDGKDMMQASQKFGTVLMNVFKLKGIPAQNVYNIANLFNLWGQDIKEGIPGSFEAGEGLFGWTDTSPTKDQYANMAVDAAHKSDMKRLKRALSNTKKANLEKALGEKISTSLYGKFVANPENLITYLDTKGAGKKPDISMVPDRGYSSFTKLREGIGDPERTQNWHHIVEQEQMDESLSGFKSTQVNNVNNIVSIPSGSRSPHAAISQYYGSVQDFTDGKTVREWLSTKSFEEQFEFGMKTLREYGDVIPTDSGWVFIPDEEAIEEKLPLRKGNAGEKTDAQKTWEVKIAEAREDKSLKDREVRDIAIEMIAGGISPEEAQELYQSQKKGDKYIGKWQGSFEDYLEGRNAMEDAKAIKDTDQKRRKVENYLRSYKGTRADELMLWKLAGFGESTFEYR